MVKFKINRHEWEIDFMNEDNVEGDEIYQTTCGLTNYIGNTIVINPMMNEYQTKTTIIHEITHAFRWSYGFVNDVEPVKITVAELDEMISNFMESFGEQIIELSDSLFNRLMKEKNGNRTSKKS